MILVTGATGNIGSEVVRQLRAKDLPVRALVRDLDKAAFLQQLGVELIQAEFDRPETLTAAMQGVEKAFLLSPPDPHQVELQGNFVKAAKSAGIQHIIKLSGAGAAEDAPEFLARLHWQTEEQIKQLGFTYTFVRPVYFMDNFLSYTQAIQRTGKIFAPVAPDLQFATVAVRDIAAVAVAALSEAGHENKIYTVTTAKLITYSEAASIISYTIRKPVSFQEIMPEEEKQQLLRVGMGEWLAASVVELYATLSSELTNDVATVTGRPPISFEEFVTENASAFKGA